MLFVFINDFLLCKKVAAMSWTMLARLAWQRRGDRYSTLLKSLPASLEIGAVGYDLQAMRDRSVLPFAADAKIKRDRKE